MKTRLAWIVGGVLLGMEAIWLFRQVRQQPSSRQQYPQPESRAELDLNHCSSEQLLQLGLDPESVERIIENRPYRNRLDLLSRIVVPEEVYVTMKDSIVVHDATEPVKVA